MQKYAATKSKKSIEITVHQYKKHVYKLLTYTWKQACVAR